MQQEARKFQSTVNGLIFSVPSDEEHTIGFLNDPSVQPFIVEISGREELPQEEAKKPLGLGEIDVADNESEAVAEPKKRGNKAATAADKKGVVELE